MKKLLVLFLALTLYNCVDNKKNDDILPYVQVNETIDLNLPEFINLNVPGGTAYASGGLKGLIIYNINGTQFKAFERAAPHLPISSSCSQMVVQNGIKMVCPCDDSEFNILNGQPLTDGVDKFAREYLVTNLNGTVLRITNF